MSLKSSAASEEEAAWVHESSHWLSRILGTLSPLRVSGAKLTPGLFFMPLLGDRTKPGPCVYRLLAPHGFRIPPHWHTKTMHQTVLAGRLIIVMGESLDSSRAQRYGAGSFLVTPAGMRHTEWFEGEGETVVHVETEGPLETVFINPGDDPPNRARPEVSSSVCLARRGTADALATSRLR